MSRAFVLAVVLAVLTLTPALSQGRGSEAASSKGTTSEARVEVKDAWVRGTVPGQSVTAAYMTLRSSEDAKVISIATPVARQAEIHESEMKDGVMRMRPAGALALPAGKDVSLEGGLHVMLMDVARPLGAGDSVPLTLTIEDKQGRRSRVEVRAPVRPLGQ